MACLSSRGQHLWLVAQKVGPNDIDLDVVGGLGCPAVVLSGTGEQELGAITVWRRVDPAMQEAHFLAILLSDLIPGHLDLVVRLLHPHSSVHSWAEVTVGQAEPAQPDGEVPELTAGDLHIATGPVDFSYLLCYDNSSFRNRR